MGKKIQKKKSKNSENIRKTKKLTKTKKSKSEDFPIVISINKKLKTDEVDKYFKSKDKYHVLQNNENLYKGTSFNCLLNKKDTKSNKFYVIQLLENNSNNKLLLFTRWGKIGTAGSQDRKQVNKISGPQLFMKKYHEKIKEGYKESSLDEKEINEEERGENENLIKTINSKDEEIKRLAEIIKKYSKTEIYHINIEEESEPEITDSKLGGLPYWPKGKKYPEEEETHEKLYLLVQFNFEKEKTDSPLPNTGILQFFISANDDYLFGTQTKQKNFRIIYHDKIDKSVTKESVQKLKIPSNCDIEEFPVQGEFKISLEKGIEYANFSDEKYKFEDFFNKAYKELFNIELNNSKNLEDLYGYEGSEKMEKYLKGDNDIRGHKVLGYANFTQGDPREEEEYEDYDTLLLQFDSEDCICWGDDGICNFFIKKKDLIKKDFSNVLFNCDSC